VFLSVLRLCVLALEIVERHVERLMPEAINEVLLAGT
jgi:hypothetical protein